MAKNIINIEGKTLEQTMKDMEVAVTNHNTSEAASDRTKYLAQAEKLAGTYNLISLYNAYAKCMEADEPMLTFIKMYEYPVVKIGKIKDTNNVTIKTEKPNGGKLTEVFNLWNFVEFCEGRNKQVTVSLDWKSKAKKTQNTLIENVQKYIEDGTEKDVLGLKTALQEMFDSIVMVAGKSGNNAVIANSKQARLIYMTCGRLDVKKFTAMFGQETSWQKQAFSFLHSAVEGKDFTCIYGDDDTAPDAETETETDSEEGADNE